MSDKMTILVVDDNDINMGILEETLKNEYDILTADTGEKALEILKEKRDDITIMLLDIILPGISGFEVLKEMDKHDLLEDIPVIMISSEQPGVYQQQALELGASDYVIRPYDMAFLKNRIANNISLHGLQRAQISQLNHMADELGNSLGGRKLSTPEIMDGLQKLTMIYDIVRLVDVNQMVSYTMTPDGHIRADDHNCFEVWGKTERCENCISAKSIKDKGKHSKYEFIGDSIYLATAKYIEIGGVPFTLEMVSKADDTVFLDAMGRESLIESVLAQNKKLYVDALTGAYNRNYYEEQLSSLNISALAVFDVDKFKGVNDTYGHLAGDEVLKTIAQLVKSKIRSTDALIRYGGDEFLLVFAGINENVLESRLELIRKSVDEYKFENYPDMHVTLSIGAVMTDRCDPAAIAAADENLYKAKETRNTVVV
ncbi:MAG: diguanylate cyclase [Eubacteriales bacterium]|nr:diguanylate cyclase [Eubacteriales bacterium]